MAPLSLTYGLEVTSYDMLNSSVQITKFWVWNFPC